MGTPRLRSFTLTALFDEYITVSEGSGLGRFLGFEAVRFLKILNGNIFVTFNSEVESRTGALRGTTGLAPLMISTT